MELYKYPSHMQNDCESRKEKQYFMRFLNDYLHALGKSFPKKLSPNDKRNIMDLGLIPCQTLSAISNSIGHL